MKNEIKFVYFDIGGVMVKDFSATDGWNRLMINWGVPADRRDEMDRKFDEFEEEVCKGKNNIEDFLPVLERDFGIKMPQDYIILDDFVDKFGKNEEMWKIVERCQKTMKVGLLTDMYPGMLSAIKKRGLIPNIDFLVIDSSIEKCKKPYEKIFNIAQKRAKVEPEEILFVDNREKNLVVPKDMGWQTFWFDSRDYEKSNKELGEFLG